MKKAESLLGVGDARNKWRMICQLHSTNNEERSFHMASEMAAINPRL